jgi:RNA recognition motif-containing protein
MLGFPSTKCLPSLSNAIVASAAAAATGDLQDDKGNSKGFGFINFEQAAAAAAAVEGLSGLEVKGKALAANRAQKKSEREAELKSKFTAV